MINWVPFIGLLALLLLWNFMVRVAEFVYTRAGLPPVAARFQATSAITGSGFTTTESEVVVRHPASRRTSRILFLFGYAGPASILALLGFGFLPESEVSVFAKGVVGVAVVLVVILAQRFAPAFQLQGRGARRVAEWLVANQEPVEWRIAADLAVTHLFVERGSAVAGKTLDEVIPEGVTVVGVGSMPPSGARETYVTHPDRDQPIRELDRLVVSGHPDTIGAVKVAVAMVADDKV